VLIKLSEPVACLDNADCVMPLISVARGRACRKGFRHNLHSVPTRTLQITKVEHVNVTTCASLQQTGRNAVLPKQNKEVTSSHP
jgi:hypothetical protein